MELTNRIIAICMALSFITLTISITSCSIESDKNFWETRQVCIKNGGSLVTRYSPTGGASVNCELPRSFTEAD